MTMRGTKETTEIVYETYCDEPNSSKPSNSDRDRKILLRNQRHLPGFFETLL